MPNYTPTIAQLRDVWVDHLLSPLPIAEGMAQVDEAQVAFDAWIADSRRQAKVAILRYAADWVSLRDIQRHGNNDAVRDAEAEASTWLEALAARIEAADV